MPSVSFDARCFRVLSYAVFSVCSGAATIHTSLTAPSSRTEAPPYQLTDVSGKIESLTDYRGKVILLNFWATECGGCRLEIPWFVELNERFSKKNVAIVGVSMDVSYEDLKSTAEAWARVTPFIRAHQIIYPILMGDDDVTKRYNIAALPATYLIDSRGRIAATYVGLIDKQNVAKNIDTLLAEKQ